MTTYHILHQVRLELQIQGAVTGTVPDYLLVDCREAG